VDRRNLLSFPTRRSSKSPEKRRSSFLNAGLTLVVASRYDLYFYPSTISCLHKTGRTNATNLTRLGPCLHEPKLQQNIPVHRGTSRDDCLFIQNPKFNGLIDLFQLF